MCYLSPVNKRNLRRYASFSLLGRVSDLTFHSFDALKIHMSIDQDKHVSTIQF